MTAEKRGMKALELWCRRVTEGYPGVKIENMTTSWRDGLAFCALIHHFRPDLIDFDRLDKRDIYKNNELAFRIAERQLGIPALLDAEDMVEYEVPDRLSILTYLSQFYQTFVSNQQGTSSPSSRSHSSKVTEIISPSAKTQKTPKVAAGRLESCWSCRRPVFLAERLLAGGKLRHRTCFTCKRCGNQLNPVGYYETEDGDFVCETCPDEEKHSESSSECANDEKDDGRGDAKDDYSIDFESALESMSPTRRDESKSKFLRDLVESSESERTMSASDVALRMEENPVDQHSTADMEKLNVKIKNLLGRDFSDTLSLLQKESDSFLADITEIIDGIINDAVKNVESRAEASDDKPQEEAKRTEVDDDTTTVESIEENKAEVTQVKPEYPKHLNPFGDDEDEDEPPEGKPPVPAVRGKSAGVNQSGQKIIEAPKVNLNPFWSEDDVSSDEDSKPVPAPRTSLRQHDSPFNRSQYGSFSSLNSLKSSSSVARRKKGPAPMPPSLSPEYRSPSPTPTIRSHRKSKPAPPPPQMKDEYSTEKKDKNYENKVKQNLSFQDKSTYGKWKRKKGQAPGLPIPQRRRITPLPLPELYRELEDLEIQQRELERQGVTIEQTIRKYESDCEEVVGKDVEGLILQLFEIVNRKNELFRRQAELMLLRRQQRLEEEHADIEYQIRCLMGRPERNKTDSDKAQEEELIRKLVEVVERRNEIIECLDMDRRREVEEDESIHHHLEAFADKSILTEEDEEQKPHSKSSPLLKYMKKKKWKKPKECPPRVRKDMDKDLDETSREEGSGKTLKGKRKWFSKS